MSDLYNYNKEMLSNYERDNILMESSRVQVDEYIQEAIDNRKSVPERVVSTVAKVVCGEVIDTAKEVVSFAKCMKSGISYMINDSISSVLSICNGKPENIKSFIDKKGKAEAVFMENMKELTVWNACYNISMYSLSKVSHDLEIKEGREVNTTNLTDCIKYSYNSKSAVLDIVIDTAKDVTGSKFLCAVASLVKEQLMPEWRVKDNVNLSSNNAFASISNSSSAGSSGVSYSVQGTNAKVTIEALNESIRELQNFITEQEMLYHRLKSCYRYNEVDFDEETCYDIEEFLNDVHMTIYRSVEMIRNSMEILQHKKAIAERYLGG
ncbi:hypothetical protein [Clostridium sp.]|uniref:hypothetical protein n=1 Tax=Clostridium sp. TaxID=1506 RepID=UPI003F2C9AF0